MSLSDEGAGLGCSWLLAKMVELSLRSGPERGLRVESELKLQLGSVLSLWPAPRITLGPPLRLSLRTRDRFLDVKFKDFCEYNQWLKLVGPGL